MFGLGLIYLVIIRWSRCTPSLQTRNAFFLIIIIVIIIVVIIIVVIVVIIIIVIIIIIVLLLFLLLSGREAAICHRGLSMV
jgi:hypothetical protein